MSLPFCPWSRAFGRSHTNCVRRQASRSNQDCLDWMAPVPLQLSKENEALTLSKYVFTKSVKMISQFYRKVNNTWLYPGIIIFFLSQIFIYDVPHSLHHNRDL